MTSKKKEVKKESLLNSVFKLLESGMTTKQIRQNLNISKQRLQYYLDKLKKDNYIKKIGYGVWQTNKGTVANSIRGHAFMWHIKLPKEIKVWDKILESKKINYKLINNNHTYQIYFRDNKVWLSKNSIIIYDINSYFSNNAIGSKRLAFFAIVELLKALGNKLGLDLSNNNKYYIKTSRQHYSLIKNCLAIQCNEKGEKINIYNEKGIWFTIDNSYNLDEAETIHPKTSLIDSLGIQKYFNEHKETKFEVTPKFILETMNGIQQNQLIFAENMKSHIKAIKKLSIAVDQLTRAVKKQNIKTNINEEQTTLDGL